MSTPDNTNTPKNIPPGGTLAAEAKTIVSPWCGEITIAHHVPRENEGLFLTIKRYAHDAQMRSFINTLRAQGICITMVGGQTDLNETTFKVSSPNKKIDFDVLVSLLSSMAQTSSYQTTR